MTLGSELTVLDAPTNLGLSPPAEGREPGCRHAPAALRSQSLVQTLQAHDAGAVIAPEYRPDRDDTGTRNGRRIASYSRTLANRTQSLLQVGRWPLVLGGDCSVLLGNMLALRRTGRPGLIFVDGHLDFRHPATAPLMGAVAGEELALATGRGHPALSQIEGLGPLVEDQHVVALGNNEWDSESLPARQTEITILDADEIRRRSAIPCAEAALAALHKRGLSTAWLHVDVDVLDADLMPAVDSPNPNGLNWQQLTDLIATAVHDPIVVGMELTVFDPDLDPDGEYAAGLLQMLLNVFKASP